MAPGRAATRMSARAATRSGANTAPRPSRIFSKPSLSWGSVMSALSMTSVASSATSAMRASAASMSSQPRSLRPSGGKPCNTVSGNARPTRSYDATITPAHGALFSPSGHARKRHAGSARRRKSRAVLDQRCDASLSPRCSQPSHTRTCVGDRPWLTKSPRAGTLPYHAVVSSECVGGSAGPRRVTAAPRGNETFPTRPARQWTPPPERPGPAPTCARPRPRGRG